MIKKILLPVDGSGFGEKAYLYALELANAYGAEITVLNIQPKHIPKSVELAYDNTGIYQSSSVEIDDTIHKNAGGEIAKKAAMYFSDRGVKSSARVVLGDPAEIILNISEKENFDAIVMCTHGMGFSKRFIMGSVTDKVVHYCSIPILVVR